MSVIQLCPNRDKRTAVLARRDDPLPLGSAAHGGRPCYALQNPSRFAWAAGTCTNLPDFGILHRLMDEDSSETVVSLEVRGSQAGQSRRLPRAATACPSAGPLGSSELFNGTVSH